MPALSLVKDGLSVSFRIFPELREAQTMFVALDPGTFGGSAVIPFGHDAEGSTVFLPFRAVEIYKVRLSPAVEIQRRRWSGTKWNHWETVHIPAVDESAEEVNFVIPLGEPLPSRVRALAYTKDMRANSGWGCLLPDPTLSIRGGHGDQYLEQYWEMILDGGINSQSLRTRLGEPRMRIYQLLPRLFGNTNPTRKRNGTIAENGCGKFRDINDAALNGISELGITHVWLTGVIEQATSTDYANAGAPADDPDLLKGLAGSPYAIKDYFDVCPDYAVNPANRLAEFHELIARIHAHGLKVLIDFVPNHVARSYQSNVCPELSFGRDDRRDVFFSPQNNFFYLRPEDHAHGPPLQLPTMQNGEAVSPTCQVLGGCDGRFAGESDCGRVTGNNVISWAPRLEDWYETVKLNYGFDFTDHRRLYPHGDLPDHPIPDTWLKMDRILAYWQEMGVDGFRCDMAHMVPPEFWAWAIQRARQRQPAVRFIAEAYDNDPAKVPAADPLLAALDHHRGNVMYDLLSAGFDAVYDDPSYKKLKWIYDGANWANDLDGDRSHPFIFHNSLRYAENHDEVRLAGSMNWGGVGMNVGRAVAAILYSMGRGPMMLYHGQEVGEPATGSEGFNGDNARTSIFDYWCMPEFAKWVNGQRYDGGLLSAEQRSLRDFYRRLIHTVAQPAFATGEYVPLNEWNVHTERFGRLGGDPASGHWLHAFLRTCSTQTVLVLTNLHPSETLNDVQVKIPSEIREPRGWRMGQRLAIRELLHGEPVVEHQSAAGVAEHVFRVSVIPPLTCYMLELRASAD